MTDGLALAGSMVFCAALTDLCWRRTSRPLAVTLLVVSFLVTAGLRAEKRWVLLATVLGVLLAWWLLRRRSAAVPRLPRGAIVRCVDETGQEHEFAIVGEDEADVAKAKISWVSPLAKALIGAGEGDSVVWKRPVGDLGLEILTIRYPVE